MKKLILPISLAANVLLVVALIWFAVVARHRAFTILADATSAEVRLQEHVLDGLESGDPERIEAIKQTLRRNIANGRQIAADSRAAGE